MLDASFPGMTRKTVWFDAQPTANMTAVDHQSIAKDHSIDCHRLKVWSGASLNVSMTKNMDGKVLT